LVCSRLFEITFLLVRFDHVTSVIVNVAGRHLRPFISLCRCDVENKRGRIRCVKYWEIIADNLHKAGWSLGWVSALDVEGRTIWIVDAHRGDGDRFIVRADEKLTAFLELERAVCIHLLIEQI
jgi:hypothetical protein